MIMKLQESGGGGAGQEESMDTMPRDIRKGRNLTCFINPTYQAVKVYSLVVSPIDLCP